MIKVKGLINLFSIALISLPDCNPRNLRYFLRAVIVAVVVKIYQFHLDISAVGTLIHSLNENVFVDILELIFSKDVELTITGLVKEDIF